MFKEIKEIFKRALPATLVCLTIFFTVKFMFGARNSIIATFMTTLFLRMRNDLFKERNFIKSIVILLILVFLSFIATKGVIFCFISNFIISFSLVYLLTDEYRPTNYFVYLMAFVFLEGFSVTWDGLLNRYMALLYSALVVYIALKIFSPKNLKFMLHNLCLKGMDNIVEQLQLILNENYEALEEKKDNLFKITTQLNTIIYDSRKRVYFTTIGGKNYFHFIIVFQHMNNITKEFLENKVSLTNKNKKYLEKLIILLKKLPKNFNSCDLEGYINNLIKFSSKNSLENKEVNLNFVYILNYLASALENIYNSKKNNDFQSHKNWIIPKKARVLNRLKHNFSLKSFKLRFSLRISILLAIGFGIQKIFTIPKGYWIPLNIYIMILPFYEESTIKVIDRLKGTVFGIIISFVLFSIFTSYASHMIILVLASVLVYGVRKYITRATYITCFSLSMSTVGGSSTHILILRLLYTFIVAAIAVLATKYIFPTRTNEELKKMVNKLIKYDKLMVYELSNLLKDNFDMNKLRELLLKSYLISDKIEEYSKTSKNFNEYYKNLIQINNGLVTEVVHIIAVISKEDIKKIDIKEMELVIQNMNSALDYIDDILNNNIDFKNIYLTNMNKNKIIDDSFYINNHILKCIDKVNELCYSTRILKEKTS